MNYTTQKSIYLSEIDKYLEGTIKNIEPTKNQKEDIQKRIDRVRSILEEDSYFVNLSELNQKSYLHGSWLRNTMIRSKSGIFWDVDLFVIYRKLIPYELADLDTPTKSKPISVFNTIKNHLNDSSLKNLVIKQDFPCITIAYADDLHFEIMPVYYCHPEIYPNLNESKVFEIPNDYDTWKPITPFKFKNQSTQINKIFNGKYKHVVKLIKHWNNSHGKYISSFLIEKLVFNAFLRWYQWGISENFNLTYRAYIKGVFEFLREWINYTTFWDKFKPQIQDHDGRYLDGFLQENQNKYVNLRKLIEISFEITQDHDLVRWKQLFPYI